MRKKIYFTAILFSLLACEETGPLTIDGYNTTIISQSAILKYRGDFYPTSGISVTGGVKIYLDNNQYILNLQDFNITSGPDLKVYLSKTNTPTDFINLGNLNNTTQYAVPNNTNFTDYKFVLIHCQAFNHLFAISNLIKI
jgi:Electron transfer DM13